MLVTSFFINKDIIICDGSSSKVKIDAELLRNDRGCAIINEQGKHARKNFRYCRVSWIKREIVNKE